MKTRLQGIQGPKRSCLTREGLMQLFVINLVECSE